MPEFRPGPVLIEPLERRRLFSSASLVGGTLTVTASEAGSDITVAADRHRAVRVTVDGVERTFDRRRVERVVISGGPGDDRIQVEDAAGPFRSAVTVDGGGGNDTLIGGAGPELLDGGDGDDVLTAGTGGQTLQGGAGDDTLTGGPGHDLLEGGDGDDLLRGGSGPNQLYGDAGNDTLDGGSGSDTLGGAAEDALYTAADPYPTTPVVPGFDSIVCGSGSDWVVGGDSVQFHQAATVVAGSGRDILDGRDGDQIVGTESGDVIPAADEYGTPAAGQKTFAVEALAVLNIYVRVGRTLQKALIPEGVGNAADRGAFYTSLEPQVTPDAGGTLLRMRDVVQRPFYLGEFFQNWGVSFSSTNVGRYLTGDGHRLEMFVNGRPNHQFQNYRMQSRSTLLPDGSRVNTKVDRITLIYT